MGGEHGSFLGERDTFKERRIQTGASETVFDAVNHQLSQHGYGARRSDD